MSIKGIDAQIMVTRSAELAKDASIQHKRPELIHDYQNIHKAEIERQKKQKVLKTDQPEKPYLHPDRDGSGAGYQSFNLKKEAKKQPEKPDELQVSPDPTNKHLIDIEI